MPVAGEFPVVAPVSAHVRAVTEQLSEATGFTVFTDAEQLFRSLFTGTFTGQLVKAGLSSSVTITV
jgi:hypothetical protein